MNEARKRALLDAIEDKVGDYLYDCRLNGWEPDADRIAGIAVAVLTQGGPTPHEGSRHPNHHCLVCGTVETSGTGCINCRQTGFDQTPCQACLDDDGASRPHVLSKDCWCQPTIEEVAA